MNILYIHSHDTGRYVQPYGFGLPSPRLQRLAEEGVMFRQAFCANPTCSPSRASLLTGRYAHSCGMFGLAHRGFNLPDYSGHLASFLRRHGYLTALAGIQHEAPRNEDIGYERIVVSKHDCHTAGDVTDPVETFLAEKHDRPFFLSVGFFETHRAFPDPDPEDDPRYLQPPLPLPDNPAVREDMAGFRKSLRILDASIGRVLDALDRNGLSGDTLVICTTDHGIAFPGMKCHLTDHGIGVMLFLRGPGPFSGGRVIDAMVSHIDIFPTICQMAGIPVPADVQGRSLVPLVAGDTPALHDEIFAEVNFHAAVEPQRCIRTERWKYIRRYDGRSSAVLPNTDDSLSKTCLFDLGLTAQPHPAEMLFDLAFDPVETCNLAADPAHASVLADMRARLDRWMADTGDPLLHGPIVTPHGAVVTPSDNYSPEFSPRQAGPV